ncbi:CD1375 family protein [Eisenbergiella tayi]|nr:CD1375 family protein [Eisenbergiella tayi]
MGRFYGVKIKAGEKTLEEVPKLWKVATEKWLRENQ